MKSVFPTYPRIFLIEKSGRKHKMLRLPKIAHRPSKSNLESLSFPTGTMTVYIQLMIMIMCLSTQACGLNKEKIKIKFHANKRIAAHESRR